MAYVFASNLYLMQKRGEDEWPALAVLHKSPKDVVPCRLQDERSDTPKNFKIMDISFSQKRRRQILDALDKCDSPLSRENMLLDKVVELQDSLLELQEAFAELSIKCRRISSCAPVPF